MQKDIILILQKSRKNTAVKVQGILTEYGDMIQARLGLHDGPPKFSADSGLIFLEMVGDEKKIKECETKLNQLEAVSTKHVTLNV